jgi:hypothetical protein
MTTRRTKTASPRLSESRETDQCRHPEDADVEQ